MRSLSRNRNSSGLTLVGGQDAADRSDFARRRNGSARSAGLSALAASIPGEWVESLRRWLEGAFGGSPEPVRVPVGPTPDRRRRPRPTRLSGAGRSGFFAVACLGLSLFMLWGASPAMAGGDWNDGGIVWRNYEAGLTQAKEAGKPVCLIFYTEWCPHCTNYSRLFHKDEVVAAAKDFVMVRLDKDKHRDLSAKYAPDGEYIPRTYFLSPDGTFQKQIHAPRQKFLYFYDESNPASLLAAMKTAAALKSDGKQADTGDVEAGKAESGGVQAKE